MVLLADSSRWTNETLNYLRLTGRSEEQIKLVETYLRENDMFFTTEKEDPIYKDIVEIRFI